MNKVKKIIARLLLNTNKQSNRISASSKIMNPNIEFVRTLIQSSSRKDSLKKLFNLTTDDQWYWILLEGANHFPELKSILPTLPDEKIQAGFTGASGKNTLDQAFLFYKLVKEVIEIYNLRFQEFSNILDFGCGWGRITRFFLKDIESHNIHGIDPYEEVVQICKSSNLNCNFHLIEPFPPTNFADNTFDLIYAYSVFSHLSEEAHKKWLNEYKRILKPNGLIVVTTRPRDFILRCAELRKMNDLPSFARGGAASFLDTKQSLYDYDQGKFCYSASGGGGVLHESFYGETCIPRKYVYNVWMEYFKDVDFINYRLHKAFDQNVIIAQK